MIAFIPTPEIPSPASSFVFQPEMDEGLVAVIDVRIFPAKLDYSVKMAVFWVESSP
jgi:hypothetical protein